MSRKEKKVYVALLPRKPSQTFISVFQSHGFDDNLRPTNSKRKGTSAAHVVRTIADLT